MSGKSGIGSIISSVILTLIIVIVLAFFALPYLYPILSSKDLVSHDDLMDESGIVIQSKYQEWDSAATIYDYEDVNFMQMEDTEINITVDEGSQIAIEFSATSLMRLESTFSGRSSYDIAIVVGGIGNRTFEVYYYEASGGMGFIRQLVFNLNYNYVTVPLNNGTYTINVFWISTADVPGDNYLSVAYPTHNYTRSLWVTELRAQ